MYVCLRMCVYARARWVREEVSNKKFRCNASRAEGRKVLPHVCMCGAWGGKTPRRSRAVRLTAGACGCVRAYACGLLTE